MSGNWIAVVAGVIVAMGGGGGVAAYRTIKGAKAQLFAGARKLNAEADGQVIDNMSDVLRVYIDELKQCQTGRAELRIQLEEARGVIGAQGERIQTLVADLYQANTKIDALESRLDRRRRDEPHEPERRSP